MNSSPCANREKQYAELTPEILANIMGCLKDVGLFGEVHLVVKNGHIRFVRTVRSSTVHTSHSGQSEDSSLPFSDP